MSTRLMQFLPPPSMRTRPWLLIWIIVAFALRLYRLDAQSLWYDEAVTANLARSPLVELTRWTANDIQPPLYYFLMAGWGQLAGWSEWSLRWPSIFFGVLTVPLLAVVARRLSGQAAVALLAAFFAALHPLLLYYSQEARMYTLLMALGLIAAYCVLRGAWQVGQWRFSAYYVLAATAASYTHYFTAFLLFALALAYWLQRPRLADRAEPGLERGGLTQLSFVQQPPMVLRRSFTTIHPFVLTNLLVVLLYLPWLGIMINRLAVDRSYWQGDFKLDEALRSVAIRFTSGETMHETTGVWLLLPYALITLFALIRLMVAARAQDELAEPAMRTLRYALLLLVIPVVGVLALAWFAPKFNARYVMLALPGLLLLWAGGFGWPSAGIGQPVDTPAPNRSRWPQPALIAGALVLLITGALWSNLNWFFNRDFSKDDWRELAEFLRPRLAPYENVILVSGHAWPVWDYYAPDIPALRLPNIDVLDVDAVLNFANTAEPLRTTFAETTGITGTWVIQWQDEVVDPAGIVPVQLELAGREKGQSSTFWGLNVRRFSRIRPQRFVDAPPITQPLPVNIDDQLALLGYHLMEDGDLLLFWQRLNANIDHADDYRITGETLDEQGQPIARLGDRRPAAYTYPVSRWQADEVVMGHIPVTDWLGPSPAVGTYTLRLTVYAMHNDQPQVLSATDGATQVELPVTITEFD